MSYPGVLERYGGYESKEDCESLGGVWVSVHRKKDGTLVNGYCREKRR